MSAVRELMDDEGENQAVRAFLMLYGGAVGAIPVIRMRSHMEMSGWNGCWPDWVASANDGETITKAGAQLWIRHLFSMEGGAA